jgi:hypothetical protein
MTLTSGAGRCGKDTPPPQAAISRTASGIAHAISRVPMDSPE